MTRFYVKNERMEDTEFHAVSRKTYKLTAKKNSEQGLPFRTGTEYVDGIPVKKITLLRKYDERSTET